MKTVRTSRVRTVLLAAIAALCLVTFGALPHSSVAATPAASAAGAAGSPSHVQVTDQHTPEVVGRTPAPSGVSEFSSLPFADLAPAGLALSAAVLLLGLLLRGRRTSVRYRNGPAPARAPPFAA